METEAAEAPQQCVAMTQGGKGPRCTKNAKAGCDMCAQHAKKASAGITASAATGNIDVTASGAAAGGSGTTVTLTQEVEVSSATLAASSAIDEEIKALKAKIKELRAQRKKVTNTSKITNKARWIFYNEHKERPEIMADIKPKLQAAGLLFQKTTMVKKVAVTKDFIPWQYVKEYTDRVFAGLGAADKAGYLEKATQEVLAAAEEE